MTDKQRAITAERLRSWVAVGMLIAALASMLWADSIWGGLAFLIAAFMAWDRPFSDNRSKGKPTLSNGGRIAVGAVLAASGMMLSIGRPSQHVTSPTAALPRFADDTGENGDNNAVARRFASLSPAEKSTAIRERLEQEQTMKSTDVEGRLLFWNEIVALAPDNAGYRRTRDRLAKEVDRLATFRENPELGAEVVSVKAYKEGFGVVMVADVTIRNRSASDLKDFQLRCEIKGPSGTVIHRNSNTLFETIAARSTRSFSKVNMGIINPQAVRASCRVESATVA